MVNHLSKAMLVVVAMAAVVTACAPASAVAEQNPGQVATSVAMTVQAQAGDIAAAVAATMGAQQAAATATESPTPIALTLPVTDTPFATFTPFVVTSGGGGSTGSTAPLYACTFYEKKPLINVFKPGDPFDIVWVITNTGTKAWPQYKDLRFVSGTALTPTGSRELPALKPGESATVSFDANAPMKPGLYGMTWKVEGGLCFPSTSIEVRRLGDP